MTGIMNNGTQKVNYGYKQSCFWEQRHILRMAGRFC